MKILKKKPKQFALTVPAFFFIRGVPTSKTKLDGSAVMSMLTVGEKITAEYVRI